MKTLFPFSTSFLDFPDNESYSIVVYFTGCSFNCKNCQNKELKNPEYNDSLVKEYLDIDSFFKDIKIACEKNRTNYLVFSGGDPLFKTNLDLVKEFLNKYGNHFNIAIYTGHDIVDVEEIGVKGFDFIKCGVYNEDFKQGSKKDNYQMALASSNQNWYNSNFERISNNGVLKFKN